MLNIAICDDDEGDCKVLSSYIHNACTGLGLKAQTTVFSHGEDLIETHRMRPYDIIFMDIYTDRINDVNALHNAAQDACHKHPCQFVFTSASEEYALMAFSLNAAHYLLKPLTMNSVREAMERCLSRLPQKSSKMLKLKTMQGTVPISIDSIEYIEVLNHICTIYTEKDSQQTYMSLTALFELLDSAYFLRVQRSYVVNMHFIDSFFFDSVVLRNGKRITLSRSNRAELKKQYRQFLLRLAGDET